MMCVTQVNCFTSRTKIQWMINCSSNLTAAIDKLNEQCIQGLTTFSVDYCVAWALSLSFGVSDLDFNFAWLSISKHTHTAFKLVSHFNERNYCGAARCIRCCWIIIPFSSSIHFNPLENYVIKLSLWKHNWHINDWFAFHLWKSCKCNHFSCKCALLPSDWWEWMREICILKVAY